MWSDGAVDTGDRCGGKDGFKIAARRELAAAPMHAGWDWSELWQRVRTADLPAHTHKHTQTANGQ